MKNAFEKVLKFFTILLAVVIAVCLIAFGMFLLFLGVLWLYNNIVLTTFLQGVLLGIAIMMFLIAVAIAVALET